MYEDIQIQAEEVKEEEKVQEPALEQEVVVKPTKSWSYTEKTRKVTTEHTLIVSEKRLSHLVEAKSAATTIRQRTDIRLDNVYSVKSGYAVAKNLTGIIVACVLALVSLITAIVMFANESTGFGVVLLVVAVIFGLIAFFISKRIKPSFVLEIDAVLPRGQLINNSYAYGNAPFRFGATTAAVAKKAVSFFRRLFGANGTKYRFIMSPEVGNDIVDTIGEYLIKD